MFCILPCMNIPLLKNFIVDLNNKKMGTMTSALGDISTLRCQKICICIHCELFEDKFTKGASSTAMFESQKRVKRDSQ